MEDSCPTNQDVSVKKEPQTPGKSNENGEQPVNNYHMNRNGRGGYRGSRGGFRGRGGHGEGMGHMHSMGRGNGMEEQHMIHNDRGGFRGRGRGRGRGGHMGPDGGKFVPQVSLFFSSCQ